MLSTFVPHILLHITFLWFCFSHETFLCTEEKESHILLLILSLAYIFPFFCLSPKQASSSSSKSEPSNCKTLTLKKPKCKRWRRWKPWEKESMSSVRFTIFLWAPVAVPVGFYITLFDFWDFYLALWGDGEDSLRREMVPAVYWEAAQKVLYKLQPKVSFLPMTTTGQVWMQPAWAKACLSYLLAPS